MKKKNGQTAQKKIERKVIFLEDSSEDESEKKNQKKKDEEDELKSMLWDLTEKKRDRSKISSNSNISNENKQELEEENFISSNKKVKRSDSRSVFDFRTSFLSKSGDSQPSSQSNQPSKAQSSTKVSFTSSSNQNVESTSKTSKRSNGLSNIFTIQRTKTSEKKSSDGQLWIDKYRPQTENDLAIHSGKIKEIKAWFSKCFENLKLNSFNVSHKLLILTGPPGCGKSVTIRVLSKELGINITEWINPVHLQWKDSENNSDDPMVSRLEEFKEFLRCSRGFCDLINQSPLQDKRMLLIEDIPYLFQSKQRQEFSEAIRRFILNSILPLVLIVTIESNHVATDFLPNDLLSLPQVSVINFNPISLTKMKKTLKLILQKENLSLPDSYFEQINEINEGDLRSAINSLQFYFIGNTNSTLSNTLAQVKKKKSTSTQLNNKLLKEELLIHGQKDQSLNLFRSLGRVLYNKRKTINIIDNENSTSKGDPDFDFDYLLSNKPLDDSSFASFLHSNYLQFFQDIDEIQMASHYFSLSDVFSPLSFEYSSLCPYISEIPSRGVMYFNNHPSQQKFQCLFKSQINNIHKFNTDTTKAVNEILFKEKKQYFCSSSILHCELLPYLISISNGKKESMGTLGSFLKKRYAFLPRPESLKNNDFDDPLSSNIPTSPILNLTSQPQYLEEDIEEF